MEKIGHEGIALLHIVYIYFQFCNLIASLSKNLWLSIPSILLLGLNNLLVAYDDKSAYALCAFSFAVGPGCEPVTFIGKTKVFIYFLLHGVPEVVELYIHYIYY